MSQYVSVYIEFKENEKSNWTGLHLTPEEYFEPLSTLNIQSDELCAEEEYSFDSVPKFFHAVEYLKKDEKDIEFTKLTIIDRKNNITAIQSETFVHESGGRFIFRKMLGTPEFLDEIFIENTLRESPKTIQQLTLKLKDSVLNLSDYMIIQYNEDGSELILDEGSVDNLF